MPRMPRFGKEFLHDKTLCKLQIFPNKAVSSEMTENWLVRYLFERSCGRFREFWYSVPALSHWEQYNVFCCSQTPASYVRKKILLKAATNPHSPINHHHK